MEQVKHFCLRQAAASSPPAALERHLQGMTEKLRSGENGKLREAIEQSVARIVVGGDGSLTIEAKPGGYSGGTAVNRSLAGVVSIGKNGSGGP